MFFKKGITRKFLILLIGIELILVGQIAFAATAGQVDDVAKEFICDCGCNKLLPACDMDCGVKLRKVISDKLDEGLSRSEVVDFMKENYGDQLLAAPEAEGSGLVAWVMPFVALIAGGASLYFIIHRLSKSKRGAAKKTGVDALDQTETKETKEQSELDSEYKKKIDEELKNFDW